MERFKRQSQLTPNGPKSINILTHFRRKVIQGSTQSPSSVTGVHRPSKVRDLELTLPTTPNVFQGQNHGSATMQTGMRELVVSR
jgi:hypothetical protein